MSERPSEQTYASDLKEWINQIIQEDKLPWSHAKVELIKDGKRTDVLVYDKQHLCSLIIEVKRPEESPSDPSVIKQGFEYAVSYQGQGLKYFATHNVNFIVFYDAVTGRRVDQFKVTYVRNLDEYQRREEEIKEAFRKILRRYVKLLQGEPPKPIDEGIIEILHGFIEGIVSSTSLVNQQVENYIEDSAYRKQFEDWLRDKGWVDPKGDKSKLEEYCGILTRQFLYMYVNKVLFYNVLRERYIGALPDLNLPDGLTADTIFPFLETYFQTAMVKSEDYETVFKTNFVDHLPLPVDTILEIVKVTKYLGHIEYSSIGYDIIGKVLEKLIPVSERHLLGQYFTRSDVVDLILSFCVRDSDCVILDPACGTGTFLVRGYYRLRYLEGKKKHPELLSQIWGVDIDKFPAHLATINLAIRDLSQGQNYPNVVYSDFFEISGPNTTIQIGLQSTLTPWTGENVRPRAEVKGLDSKVFKREMPSIDTVVGNPPYTRQEEMGSDVFGQKYKQRLSTLIETDFPDTKLPLRSGIYSYFFVHGTKFLHEKSRLGFVCLRSWLDAAYGEPLKEFILQNFKIVAIIESKSERWFHDAQMLPCIVVLEVCSDKAQRTKNTVKFVQLKANLSKFVPPITDERDMVQEIHRWKKADEFTQLIENPSAYVGSKHLSFMGKDMELFDTSEYRIVGVSQDSLSDDPKWGKYLRAPSVFFDVLERGGKKLVELSRVADVNLGIKTGANEFFCVPNKFFTSKREKGTTILISKATKKEQFQIEQEFLKPVVTKIKKHRKIDLSESDGSILLTGKSLETHRPKPKVLD